MADRKRTRSEPAEAADLKARAYRDDDGDLHHHTRTFMEQHGGEQRGRGRRSRREARPARSAAPPTGRNGGGRSGARPADRDRSDRGRREAGGNVPVPMMLLFGALGAALFGLNRAFAARRESRTLAAG